MKCRICTGDSNWTSDICAGCLQENLKALEARVKVLEAERDAEWEEASEALADAAYAAAHLRGNHVQRRGGEAPEASEADDSAAARIAAYAASYPAADAAYAAAAAA